MTLSDRTGNSFSTQGGEFLCEECASPLIQPLEWVHDGRGEWSINVRCPDCFHHGRLVLDEELAHLFENALDEAARGILETAEFLDREVFRHGCETFIKALRGDRISSTDF
jgi:hypothetical protein